MNRPSDWTRRDFLRRSAQAGGAAALAGALAAWRWRAQPPPSEPPAATVTLPDFSLADAGLKMAIVRNVTERTAAVRRGLEALGGAGRFIARGDRVLLKVNAAFASPPLLGATTHPDLVVALARACYDAGAADVVVTDNPINDPESCFTWSGLGAAAQAGGARLALPRSSEFHPTTLPGGALVRNWPLLSGPFRGITKLIGVAPVKDHFRSGASLTLKNWYGLLGGRRNLFHQDVHTLIGELARLVRPTLVVLDGTVSMRTNGPTGGSPDDLAPTRTLVLATDGVAADAFGATLLERRAADLPFLGLAAAAGAGVTDWASLHPAEVAL